MLALCLPWGLLLALITACVLLGLRKWRWALLFLLIVFLINGCFHVFPVNLYRDNSENNGFKVLSWNIDGSSPSIRNHIRAIGKAILKEDADIVYLAEDYYYCRGTLDSLLKTAYPFSTYSIYDECHYFYSKYPLGEHKRIAYDSTSMSYIVQSSVKIDGRIVDLFGCHLSSNNYSQ